MAASILLLLPIAAFVALLSGCSAAIARLALRPRYGAISAQTTPLPAALPLVAGGLDVIGLLARRRKQRQSAALP